MPGFTIPTSDDTFTMKQRADLYNFKWLKMGGLLCIKRLKLVTLNGEHPELGIFSRSWYLRITNCLFLEKMYL
jgi:hypothetical protein